MTRDQQRQTWMEYHLAQFAEHFGVRILSDPVHSGRLHSVGAKVDMTGELAWLRVVYADPDWGVGNYLDGNVTANQFDVPRPRAMCSHQYDDHGRTLRGELLTYVRDQPVADEMVLVADPMLPAPWYDQLRAALDLLAAYPTPRSGLDPDDLDHGIQAFFGVEISTTSVPWRTAHCDLHWGNVTAPGLYLLDWEIWGRAPDGYDAATLYCSSLAVPEVNRRVHGTLLHLLETPGGRVSTLAAAVRFLRLVDEGEHSALAPLLHAAARSAIARL
ncbi:hypothetical protein [Kribbella karoonensis]|uniref:Phosphotransferase family enzyme n=1 Tax=Kribbella karoonensis TaxID=324851 RepID=A0ABN2DLX6_9ACTN